MNTLTGIEAERVNQILQHALDRLQIVAHVPNNWDEDILLAISEQDALASSLHQLWAVEQQFLSLNDATNEGGRDLSLLRECHRSVRSVCRFLLSDRQALGTLMNVADSSKSSRAVVGFISYLNDLRQLFLSRMTTTVEDEAANRSLLHELTERERQLEESRDVLQAKLAEVTEEKERVTSSLDQVLRKLQSEKQESTQVNAYELESIRKEMNDAINKATNDHDQRMRQLQDQIEALERQNADIADRNRDEEVRLRKEKTRAEVALAAKIALYDADMASKKQILAELTAAYREEVAEYAILREHFDEIDADISRSEDENKILDAVKRRELFGRWVLDRAATNIQKYIRGRSTRIIVAKLKAKLKKKRKGKGKKGKSKK